MTRINSKNKAAGFTMIEILIYLALFGIMLGGAVLAAYSLLESSGRNQARAVLQEEGDFLVNKINWALSNISSVQTPTSSSLCITELDSTIGTITIDLPAAGSDMRLTRSATCGTGTPNNLNNANVKVSGLSFVHQGSGTNPEQVNTNFTLSANTPTGQAVTETFQNTKFLRK